METNKERYQVIMLPTDKDGAIWKFDAAKTLIVAQGSLTSDIPFTKFHLHAVSNDEIKEGDWHINLATNEIEKASRNLSINWINNITVKTQYKKIVASTDKEITPSSWLPKSYVEWYVDKANDSGVPVDYIYLECEPKIQKLATGEEFIGSSLDYNLQIRTIPDLSVVVWYGEEKITLTIEQAKDLYWLGRTDKVDSDKNGRYIDNSDDFIKQSIERNKI